MKHTQTRIVWPIGVLALSLLALGGCSSQQATAPSTQVAAKVGKEEISMHQINAVLAQGNERGATAEQLQLRSSAILESLIDQQLAVDEAIAAELNRAPDVIAKIEATRRAILAGAYVNQLTASLPKPEEQDARDYYLQHPALFAQRRVFSVQEIVTANTPKVFQQLDTMTAGNAPLESAIGWLKGQSIPHTANAASRAAEQIPMELLPRMHALKDGQNTLFATPTTLTLLRLVESRTAPIPEAIAVPRIAQYLYNQRTADAVAAQMKTLRSKTTVEYMGAFSQRVNDTTAGSNTSSSATRLTGTTAPSGEATVANPMLPTTTLEKGVAGLK